MEPCRLWEVTVFLVTVAFLSIGIPSGASAPAGGEWASDITGTQPAVCVANRAQRGGTDSTDLGTTWSCHLFPPWVNSRFYINRFKSAQDNAILGLKEAP